MLRRTLLEYVAISVLSFLGAMAVMGLRVSDLRTPLKFSDDGVLHAMMIKTIIKHGWVLTNPDLGFPGRLDLRDFPAFDNLNVFVIRLLAFGVSDHFLLLNLTLLVTFPLTAVAGYFVSRKLDLSRSASFFVAILYALAPFHFRRGVGHLFLAGYYMVPIAVLFAITASRGVWERPGRKQLLLIALALVAIGSNGAYYPFFSCFIFLIAGINGVIRIRSLRGALPALALIVATTGIVVLNALPLIVHEASHGALSVRKRAQVEGDAFGFKPAQLVLPITGHRVSTLERLRERYNAGPLTNENEISSLGLTAAIGFLVLLWRAIFRRPAPAETDDALSTLNLAIFLLGAVGGLGALFSLFVWPQIRGYNRVSIYIMFFGLLVVARWFDGLMQRRQAGGVARATFAAVLMVLATTEQTSSAFAQRDDRGPLLVMQRYVRQIEHAAPEGVAMLQLPYHPFPEHGWRFDMQDYDHFRPYLLTDRFRWSYGSVKGRRGDLVQALIAEKSPRELADNAAAAGFGGILIDRFGYGDRAAALEGALRSHLIATPIGSDDGRYAFFGLLSHRQELQKKVSPQAWRTIADRAANPLVVCWRGGFSGLEVEGTESWHWSSHEGVIAIENSRSQPIEANLAMEIEVARRRRSKLRIESRFVSARTEWRGKRIAMKRRITIPPGVHEIVITSNARRARAPEDPRVLVFRLMNFRLDELGAGSAPESPAGPEEEKAVR